MKHNGVEGGNFWKSNIYIQRLCKYVKDIFNTLLGKSSNSHCIINEWGQDYLVDNKGKRHLISCSIDRGDVIISTDLWNTLKVSTRDPNDPIFKL